MTRHIKFWRYYNRWVDTYKLGQVRATTLQKYKLIGRNLEEMVPDLYLDKIKRSDFQRLVNEYGKTHEIKTVHDFRTHVASCLHDAVYEGDIKKDPTYKVVDTSQIKHKKKHKWIESLDEVRKLVEVFHKHDDTPVSTMFDFDLRTGLRFAELMGLTPKDVDQRGMTIYVNKTFNYKKIEEGKFIDTKNKYSNRVIKIDWQAMQDLQKMMVNCPEGESIFHRAWAVYKRGENEESTTRIFNSTFNKILKRYCEEAGIEPITIHGLRHTHASILISQGVSIQSVAKRLGHGNTMTTQRVYIHLLDDLAMKDDNKMMTVLSSL